VALERRIIDYPDWLEGRGQAIGRGCSGLAEHGLTPARLSNGRARRFRRIEAPAAILAPLARFVVERTTTVRPDSLATVMWEQKNGPPDTRSRARAFAFQRKGGRRPRPAVRTAASRPPYPSPLPACSL
jgi:hypothetical protein